MTLILTCVTPQYVVQVSDRRLTRVSDGKVVENPQNKTLFVCGYATYAFTGLSMMGRTPTDLWLMDHLAGKEDPLVELDATAEAATQLLRHQTFGAASPQQRRAWRRVAFVGGGFVGLRRPERFNRSDSADRLHPFLAVVSNFYSPPDTWLPEADVRCGLTFQFLPENENMLFLAAGFQPTKGHMGRLRRDVRRCLIHSKSPWPVARVLARGVREVADQSSLVGRNLMCMLLPRPKRPGDLSPSGGRIAVNDAPPLDETEVFSPGPSPPDQSLPEKYWVYWPNDPSAFPYYGPNLACGGHYIGGSRLSPAELTDQEASELAPGPPPARRRSLP